MALPAVWHRMDQPARLNPRRWLRWLASGLVSAATPLPWLVDVTAARFDALERRVAKLECERQATVTADRGVGWTVLRSQ
jgi:hypothetical protein